MAPPVFVGCGFAAGYLEGGGNFSVPLQYLTGLRRMGRRGIWMEVLRRTDDPHCDAERVRTFRARMKQYDLEYCLLLAPQRKPSPDPELHDPELHDLDKIHVFGMNQGVLLKLMAESSLLNLSYSIKPPLLELFGRRLLCSLDPTEMLYWMDQMEMGQSYHDEFWSVGLCMDSIDPRLPKPIVPWNSYFPLVDTELLKPQPQPRGTTRFTTIGQWYWDGMILIEGDYREFSKKEAFRPYLDLPKQVSDAQFELAMNFFPGDTEPERLRSHGWRVVDPHRLTPTPDAYYHYLSGASAEFTAVKLEAIMGSGWMSDRSAAFMALGRPVITEPTGAESHLPMDSGMLFVRNLDEAIDASRRVLSDWQLLSMRARSTAVECFDSVRNLKLLLGEI